MATKTKTRTESSRRLTPREAVRRADEFVRGLYPKEDLTGLRLEAVELSDEDWIVTVSFVPRVYPDETSSSPSLLGSLGGSAINPRLYKDIHVRATDGEAHAMISTGP